MITIEREVDRLGTVGEMRAALADLPADMSLGDVFDEPLCLQILHDTETGERTAAIR